MAARSAPEGKSVSAIFWGLIGLLALSGAHLAAGDGGAISVFVFVAAGWVISLCLHEWGHAIFAFQGGDRSVLGRGYLTLNPLKYVNPMMSIVLPLAFLAMGGFGLPGGAVYINTGSLRGALARATVSAAGPAMNLLCLLGVGIVIHLAKPVGAFAAGLALLGYLQATALILNLLPIPGLDGFGILESVLPPKLAASIRPLSGIVLIGFFVAIFAAPQVLRPLWDAALGLCQWVGVERFAVGEGFDLFRFWLAY